MRKKNYIVAIVLVLGFVACRQEKVFRPSESSNDSVSTGVVQPCDPINKSTESLKSQSSQIRIPPLAGEKAEKFANDSPPLVGRIVAKKRAISAGEEYLNLLADGLSTAPRNLTTEQIKKIDLKSMKADSRPVKYTLPDKAIADSTLAFARAMDMDVPISRLADTRCRGVFEDTDCFVIFYGFESESLEDFQHVYIVKKANGNVSEFTNQK